MQCSIHEHGNGSEGKVSIISSNWRGEPLRDYETLTKLIANTVTAKGLTVRCRLDRGKHPTGYRVAEEEMHQIGPRRWNRNVAFIYLRRLTRPLGSNMRGRWWWRCALYPPGRRRRAGTLARRPARHERLAPFRAVLVSLSIGRP